MLPLAGWDVFSSTCEAGRYRSEQETIVPAVLSRIFLSWFTDMLIVHRVPALGINLYLGTHECF